MDTITTNTATIAAEGKSKPAFDISLLKNIAAITITHLVELAHNDDGDMLAGLEIVGKNSEQYQKAIRETTKAAIKRGQQKNAKIDGKTDEGAGKLYDLGEDRNRTIAKAVVVGAPGFVANGEPVAVTPEFLDLCFDAQPTWQEKVLAALEQDGNFLKV